WRKRTFSRGGAGVMVPRPTALPFPPRPPASSARGDGR
ncbi:MAG: hypothetical protein AVDCRST_MAG03-3405, partial [uncultured Rubrobacteraceae bacterium]